MPNVGTLGMPGSEIVGFPQPANGGFFISMWSGPINAIPAGWAVCDGQGGLPDLRDRFIVGAGNTYPVGLTGGNATYQPFGDVSTPTFTGDALATHTHTLPTVTSTPSGTGSADLSAPGANGYATDTHTHSIASPSGATSAGTPTGTISTPTFTGMDLSSVPPFYALCYIAFVGSTV